MSISKKKKQSQFKKAFWPPWKILLKFHCLWSDRSYLEYMYRHKMNKKVVLANDNSDLSLYTEKVQWLKLYDRQPEHTDMVDKYNVRKFIAQTIGEEYLIPNYGVWDKFDDIPFDSLPDQFVLKCTHDSASRVLCKDKKNFNIEKARKHFNKCLSRNYFWRSRQWAYKNIKPRIIAEEFMKDKSSDDLMDYKIFCFDGEPKVIQVDFDRFTSHKVNFYSTEWEFLPVKIQKYANDPAAAIKKPDCLEQLLFLARKLSSGKIHMRVDLYVINEKIYFGELTFYPDGGFGSFDKPEWDIMFGNWLALPNS